MADDEISDAELDEEEAPPPEKIGIDYEELDEVTGFKKVDWRVWQAYTEAVLNKPEDEREEPDEWAENYATENNIDVKRIQTAIKLGIYAGGRDEFNQRSGEGKAIYANGDTYEGQYWEGKKSGQGKYIHTSLGMSEVDKALAELFKTRDEYEGDDDFAARAAKTLYIGVDIVLAAIKYGLYPCYHGGYINNRKHGKGVMKNKDGSVYRGDWKDNKRHGEGVYSFLNGDVYSGQWEDGFKHGAGCYTFADGKGQYIGVWEKGIFREGQWKMCDNNIYEGKFDNKNRPCDPNGVIKFTKLGLVQQGDYKKGKWCPKDDLIPADQYAQAQDANAPPPEAQE